MPAWPGTTLPHQVLHTALRGRQPCTLAFCRLTQTVHPRTSTSTFGPRAFCSSGLLSWNALPSQLRDPAISINIFTVKLVFSTIVLIDCVSFYTMYSVFLGSVTARAFVTVSVQLACFKCLFTYLLT